MQRIFVAIAAALALCLAGCAGAQGPSTAASSSDAVQDAASSSRSVASDATEQEAAFADEAAQDEREQQMLKIEVGDTIFQAAFEENSSAEALAELLAAGPLTLHMHDYGGFEKVGSLPQSLPTNDRQIATVPGDVILYQGNQITIYYDQNSWNFTRMAKIEGASKESLLAALGAGDIEVTFSLA